MLQSETDRWLLMVLGGGWLPLAVVTSSRAPSPLQGGTEVLQRQPGVCGEEVGPEGACRANSECPLREGLVLH